MLENQLNQCFMVIFSFFIVRRSGNPGYNFAIVIGKWRLVISHVSKEYFINELAY